MRLINLMLIINIFIYGGNTLESFYELIFSPRRNVMHWNNELGNLAVIILLVCLLGAILWTMFYPYKRSQELKTIKKGFWMIVLVNIIITFYFLYANLDYLIVEGGVYPAIKLTFNTFIISVFFNYLFFSLLTLVKFEFGNVHLRNNFIKQNLKSLFLR
jgi:hypothetical protein